MGVYGLLGAGAIAVVMAGVIWWQSGQIDSLRSSLETWKEMAQVTAASIAEMADDRKRLENALAKREADLRAIRSGLEEQRALIAKAVRNDEAVADWGRTPVPDAVLDVVRRPAFGGTDGVSAGAAAGTSAASDAGTADKRKNKR